MGKVPFTDWEEWATGRPGWIHEDIGDAFDKFVEQKWKNALNVVAAEPGDGRLMGVGLRGSPKSRLLASIIRPKQLQDQPKLLQWMSQLEDRSVGSPAVPEVGRITQRPLARLSETSNQRPKKSLWQTAGVQVLPLALADAEGFGEGSDSNPACEVPECKRQHTENFHEMMTSME